MVTCCSLITDNNNFLSISYTGAIVIMVIFQKHASHSVSDNRHDIRAYNIGYGTYLHNNYLKIHCMWKNLYCILLHEVHTIRYHKRKKDHYEYVHVENYLFQ